MSKLRRPVGPEDHLLGSPDAPLTLVEYGDHQCPYCAAAQRDLKKLLREMGDQIAFVFRHFPLTQVHPHSMQAAEAAESAGAQGRFWEMHDLLFENQASLDLASLLSYADALELDVPRFLRNLKEHRYEQRIRRDFMDGVRSGVNGTPTFFINGVRHEGGYTFESLLDAIQGGARSYY